MGHSLGGDVASVKTWPRWRHGLVGGVASVEVWFR